MSPAKLLVSALCLTCTPGAGPDATVRDTPSSPPDCPEEMRRIAGGNGVEPFCLDALETTAGGYAGCVASGICTAAVTGDGHGCNSLFHSRSDHPINCVDLGQADRYCRWQSKRIPDDEQWLWAAHGGARGTAYPWGDTLAPGRACTDRRESAGTCAVGSFEDASPDGLRDLVGNVAEWTLQSDRGGLRGGSWRYRPNLQPGDWRSEQASPQSGIRCAAALGAVGVAPPAGAATPPAEEVVALTLPKPAATGVLHPLDHLDLLSLAPASHRSWAELPDGQFIPFVSAGPRDVGLAVEFDGSGAPPALAGCEPLRGLRASIVLECPQDRSGARLVAVDRADHTIVWEQPFRGLDPTMHIHFGPAHLVVVDTEGGEAIGYSLRDGRPVWGREITPEEPIWSDDTGLYVVNRRHSSPMLMALDAARGTLTWQIPASCGPVSSDGLILENEQGFHRIDPLTGAVEATVGAPRDACESMESRTHAPFVAAGRRFELAWTADHKPLLRAANLATGQVLWERSLSASTDYDTLAVDADAIYWLEDDRLLAVDPDTGSTVIALTIGPARSAPRLLTSGTFGSLLVVPTYYHTATLGRVAEPVVLEDYTIRGRIVGRLEGTGQHLMLGPHSIPLDTRDRFEVHGRRAVGARLSLVADQHSIRPDAVVLDGGRTYDLGDIRVRPSPRTP